MLDDALVVCAAVCRFSDVSETVSKVIWTWPMARSETKWSFEIEYLIRFASMLLVYLIQP